MCFLILFNIRFNGDCFGFGFSLKWPLVELRFLALLLNLSAFLNILFQRSELTSGSCRHFRATDMTWHKWKWWFALKTSWPTRSIKINLQYKTFSVLYILLWLWNAHFEQLNHESSHPSPSPPTGGAGFLANLRGHPRGLGQDGGIPGGRAGQRWAAGQADGPAEGVDVESDPGERPVPFPKSPRCQRSSTPPRGEGHQRSHLSRTGCWPASQSLFFILFITVITGTALSDKEQIADQGHSLKRRARKWPWLCGLHKKTRSLLF